MGDSWRVLSVHERRSVLFSRGYVTNGVTTSKSKKMDGRKRLIEQEVWLLR